MKDKQPTKKKNKIVEAFLWLAALTMVIIGISASCMMVSLAFFFVTKSI